MDWVWKCSRKVYLHSTQSVSDFSRNEEVNLKLFVTIGEELLKMPQLYLKDDSVQAQKGKDAHEKTKVLPFWNEVAKDVLKPFAPKIPTLAMQKYKQKVERDQKIREGNKTQLLSIIHVFFDRNGETADKAPHVQ